MTRRLLPRGTDVPGWLVTLILGGVMAGTLAISVASDEPQARPAGADEPPTPYETCLLAANTPGPSGFATEVCEPLSPFWEEPITVRPADFTERTDGCLFFRYDQIHPDDEQADWGDKGDGEFYCPR